MSSVGYGVTIIMHVYTWSCKLIVKQACGYITKVCLSLFSYVFVFRSISNAHQ
ncbi:uncharacterized protein EKO05_0008009 [Ascochyta rabiei]|uniref:uncharacterized protein n=1 Tax=Didymella rabiei TaxID=5454 RepID=UPI00220B0DB5|nr:uncharacterized protein EKO05_0008009 [Ascochyta rabiei]UPX17668.1 hypothetical protein EKO05_0008009 [Ascochyta rabiei]